MKEYGSIKGMCRVKYILILLLFSSQVFAGEFTRETPEGAVYDTRTHYYKSGRVILKPELRGLRGDDKREAYKLLGLVVGGHDHQKWLDAQERWKQELESRRERRRHLPPRKMSPEWTYQTLRAAGYYYNPVQNHYRYSGYRPMTYWDYWYGRNYSNYNNQQIRVWTYYGY